MAYRNYSTANGHTVDPSGNGDYSTIAAAISAASSGQTIFLRPGTYTENLTLKAGVNLTAFGSDGSLNGTGKVIISGTCTMTTAGSITMSGVQLQTNSAAFLAVTGTLASVVNLSNCYLNSTNATGITYSSSSGSSGINISYCRGDTGTTGIAHFTDTGSGGLNITHSQFTNTGASTTSSTTSTAPVSIQWSSMASPLTTSSTGTFGIFNSFIDTSATNSTSLTTAGSGATNILNSSFASGSASSISIGVGSSVTINNSEINTSNSSAIAGAGGISYGGLTFLLSSLIATTTQVPYVFSNDALKIKSPGAYPYTTIPQDAVILVDTSSARTIVPLASPTTGQKHIIKDSVGSAAANNITVTPSGKNIDGAASSVINVNYGSINIVYNGSEWSIF